LRFNSASARWIASAARAPSATVVRASAPRYPTDALT
jgi:hypothetical protein